MICKSSIAPCKLTQMSVNSSVSFLLNDLSFAENGNELIAIIDNYIAQVRA